MKEYTFKEMWLLDPTSQNTIDQKLVMSPTPGGSRTFLKRSLNTDNYDIDFAISILETILGICQKLMLNPKDLHLTLKMSCSDLLSFLQTEKVRKK